MYREIYIHVANLCIYETDNPDPWKKIHTPKSVSI